MAHIFVILMVIRFVSFATYSSARALHAIPRLALLRLDITFWTSLSCRSSLRLCALYAPVYEPHVPHVPQNVLQTTCSGRGGLA